MTLPAEDPDVPSLFLDTNIILDVLRNVHIRTQRLLNLRLPFLEYLWWLNDDGWTEATRLCGETDIDPSDCINLAAAKFNGAFVFITKDGALIRLLESQLPGYIEATRPDQVDDTLGQFRN